MYDPEEIDLPPNYMPMPAVNCGRSNWGAAAGGALRSARPLGR